MSEKEYLFVWDKDGGWYLKIDSVEALTDYYERTLPGKYEGAINLYREALMEKEEGESVLEYFMRKPAEERIRLTTSKDFMFMYAAILKAEKQEGATFLDGLRFINLEAGGVALKDLRENGAVYFNSVGGKTFQVDYSQFCRRKELVFPCYSESDIRIGRFKGGTHYYAYIGDMQVRDGDILKWNTFDEAYKRACEIVTGE